LIWERRLSAGYELSDGNTDAERIFGDFLINRNRLRIDEWTLEGSAAQEYSNDKKNTQRADGSIRYAYTFWEKFYNFYRFEGIKARLLPSTGVGYWFSDTETLKLLAETGAGWQFEFFEDEKEDLEPVLHARGFFTKKITENLELGTDFYYFPVLEDFGDYRFEGEGFLRASVAEHVALKIKLEDQYRSKPRQGAKRNDLRLISGLELNF